MTLGLFTNGVREIFLVRRSNGQTRVLSAKVKCEFLVHGVVNSRHVLLQNTYQLLEPGSRRTGSDHLTSFLIDGEHWNLGAGAPSRNLRSLVYQPFNVGLRPVVLLSLENNAEMLGDLLKSHDISLDILRGAVVVVKDGRDLVADNIPKLAQPDVEREEAVQYGECENVELVLEEATNAQW
jgi:hypothetical protein